MMNDKWYRMGLFHLIFRLLGWNIPTAARTNDGPVSSIGNDVNFLFAFALISWKEIVEASGRGQIDVVSTLLQRGISINSQDKVSTRWRIIFSPNKYTYCLFCKHGSTALMEACRNRRVELVSFLLSQGASAEIRDHVLIRSI